MSALHSHHLATVAYQPCANDVEGRVWMVAVRRHGESIGYHRIVASCCFEAWSAAHDRFPDAVRIEPLPLVPLNYREGFDAYAHGALHEDATPEAKEGWVDACMAEQRRKYPSDAQRQARDDWNAVVAQNSHVLYREAR